MLEQAEGEEDALNFAERMAQLMREAGVLPPELTLEYRDLCVEADALVGSAGIPSMGNSFKQMLKRATCQVGRGGGRRDREGCARHCATCSLGLLGTITSHLDAPHACSPCCLRMPQGGLETRPFKILKGVSGVLRPGTVTLLLGPPGEHTESEPPAGQRAGVHVQARP